MCYIVTMYIRTTTRKYKTKTYTNHILVESVHTPKGPRQRTVCSLGDLKPRSRTQWLKLAHKVEVALVGQGDLFEGAGVRVVGPTGRSTLRGVVGDEGGRLIDAHRGERGKLIARQGVVHPILRSVQGHRCTPWCGAYHPGPAPRRGWSPCRTRAPLCRLPPG